MKTTLRMSLFIGILSIMFLMGASAIAFAQKKGNTQPGTSIPQPIDNLSQELSSPVADLEYPIENLTPDTIGETGAQVPHREQGSQPVVEATIPYQPAQSVVNQDKQNITLSSLPPHILLEPGVLSYLQSKGLELPQEIKAMYGPVMEELPPVMPISPHVLNNPIFLNYLESVGIEPPKG